MALVSAWEHAFFGNQKEWLRISCVLWNVSSRLILYRANILAITFIGNQLSLPAYTKVLLKYWKSRVDNEQHPRRSHRPLYCPFFSVLTEKLCSLSSAQFTNNPTQYSHSHMFDPTFITRTNQHFIPISSIILQLHCADIRFNANKGLEWQKGNQADIF